MVYLSKSKFKDNNKCFSAIFQIKFNVVRKVILNHILHKSIVEIIIRTH